MDFNIVWHAVQSVLTLCIIGCTGYVLARKGWFTPEAKALLPRLVIQISLPCYMVYNMTNTLTREQLFHLVYGSLVPFASILIAFGLSLAIAPVIKVAPRRRGIFYAGFSASNTMFIGLPVNLALFGEAALPYVLLYYFANCTFFWTVGNYFMAADGEGPKEKLCSISTLRRILSPPMLGFLTGVCLLLLDVRLPAFLHNTVKYMGNLTTPLILIFLGVMLQGVRLRGIRLTLDLACLLLGRFVISPLIIVAITSVFPLPELMRKVFIIQAALPAVASISLLAGYYKTDPEFGTVVVSATTLISMITTPIIMIIVSH